MKRALTIGLLLIATAASSANLQLATKHDVAPSRASSSRKVQWAPSGNFQALHARPVFGSETETASRPYARENLKTAAGAGIFLSRDGFEGSLNSAPSLHRFTYAHANPLRYTDPSGHAVTTCDGTPANVAACTGKDAQDIGQVAEKTIKFGRPKPPLSSLKSPTEAVVRETAKGPTTAWWVAASVRTGVFFGAIVGAITGAKSEEFRRDEEAYVRAIMSPEQRRAEELNSGCSANPGGGDCHMLRIYAEAGYWKFPEGENPQGEMDERSDQPLKELPGDEAAQQRGGMTDDLERTPHSDPAVDGAPESMELRTRAQIRRGPVSPSNPDYGSETGRRGSLETRRENDRIRDEFLRNNPGWKHVGGGTDLETGQKLPEEYLRGPQGTKGSSYVDLTFRGPGGERIRINTVDIDLSRKSQMTEREETNRDRIWWQQPSTPIITIPKGTK
ncbi:MAG: hypothetical protein Q8K32_36445 [Archangium sp.]|nr:hypothetical protein [Archangium sp.]